jgi:hypothetical protein
MNQRGQPFSDLPRPYCANSGRSCGDDWGGSGHSQSPGPAHDEWQLREAPFTLDSQPTNATWAPRIAAPPGAIPRSPRPREPNLSSGDHASAAHDEATSPPNSDAPHRQIGPLFGPDGLPLYGSYADWRV